MGRLARDVCRVPYVLSSPTEVNTVVTPNSRYVTATAWWDETSILWAGAVNDGEADYGAHLFSTPIDLDSAVFPTNTNYLHASDWWDNTSLIWSGETYDGQGYSYAVVLSPIDIEGAHTILDCAPARNELPLFDYADIPIEKLAVVPGGLLAETLGQLWYLPVMVGDGLPYASCEVEAEGNRVIASGVADFEVSPDGQTLALITQQGEGATALAIGPVGEVLDTSSPLWTTVVDAVNLQDYYTGLHWIAGSQQLVWTAVKYEGVLIDEIYSTEIHDSAVYKVNADGTHLRTLVYNTLEQANQQVVTTGPIDLAYPRYATSDSRL